MYTEEPRRYIDWGNVLRKVIVIIIILLIIFLFIWLFNKNKNINKTNVNYNGNTTINENSNSTNNNNNDYYNTSIENDNNSLNPSIYSESFITNYSYFHSIARDFVTENNLPVSGNTVRYTMQELINKGLLLPASYNNSTCNRERSYVEVTNVDGKYTMTTYMVCGAEIAKTTEQLKCSALCNGNCNVPEDLDGKDYDYATEYEFKQAYNSTGTSYSCPAGYTKTGSGANTKCTATTTNTVAPDKNVTYSCPAGYTKTGSGANTKCTIGASQTIKATPKTTYSCDKDYILNSNNKCVRTTTDTKNPNANTTYSCPKDYKLNSNNKCVKSVTETKDPKANTTYSCPKDYKLNSNNKCVKSTTTYKCTNGTLVNETYCRVYTTGSYYTSYTSYYGTTYGGCTYSGSSTTPCTNCVGSTRTVYNYLCSKTTYSDSPATAVTNTDTVNPTTNTTYSCDKDYTLNSNNKCVKTTTDTVNSTANTTYSCDKNYTLNSNNKCVKTTNDTKNPNANTTYSCTTGRLSGTNCIVDKTETINASKNTTYTCPAGYTKEGLATSAVCKTSTTKSVNPTSKTTTVTKYRTKWSTATSLEGWTRTGKTRTVKVG